MRRFVICLFSAICLFTTSAADAICCAEDFGNCEESHQMKPEKGDQHSKSDSKSGSHSCCHAHHVVIKIEKPASSVQLSTISQFTIPQNQLVTQHKAGVLLQPPAQA